MVPDTSFSKRLRKYLLDISSTIDKEYYPAILGLALSLAGRSDGSKISLISEQSEYLDLLVLAAKESKLPAPERIVYAKGESLIFDLNQFDPCFREALPDSDSGSHLPGSDSGSHLTDPDSGSHLADPDSGSHLTDSDFISKSSLSRQMFLGHTFLACGSLADPNIQFSLEWQVATEEAAKALKSKLDTWSLNPGLTSRKRIHVLYIKSGESIADFLIMCGATDLLLELVDIRVKREVSAGVNRLMNCDEANSNRQVDTAARQLTAIRYIAAKIGLSVLPDNLRLAAEARLAAPELSIKELGEHMEPPIGKSGMNHRLRKLEEIAEDLRQEEQ
ncbi:MAG TPA: DNA-binding protein WhiA [Clostridiaceae bacterium]|nr:DNA-binding protein WhiA [Clostridiaceae bacterium]